MNEQRGFYYIKEVADELQVAVSTVHRYIEDGLLKAYQIGGRGPWRIKPGEFKKFKGEAK